MSLSRAYRINQNKGQTDLDQFTLVGVAVGIFDYYRNGRRYFIPYVTNGIVSAIAATYATKYLMKYIRADKSE